MEFLKRGKRSSFLSNVGEQERVISVLAGTLLLADVANKRKNIVEGITGGYLLFRGITGFCPIYQVLEKNSPSHDNHHISIKLNLNIKKSRQEVYSFWRKLENLPLFMEHLKSVKVIDDVHSEWKAKLPGGIGVLTWSSKIVKDIPNQHIGWHSSPDAPIENKGNVKFLEIGPNETEAHIAISYIVPGGIVGEGLGRLFQPLFEEIVKEDVKNLQEFLDLDKAKI